MLFKRGVTHVYRHAVQPLIGDVSKTKQLRQASNIGLVRLVGARVTSRKLVELVLLGVEAAEADREQDGGGGSETGHDGVVLDEERVGGKRNESLADAARDGREEVRSG
jgi:hypothetical protein